MRGYIKETGFAENLHFSTQELSGKEEKKKKILQGKI